MELEKSMIKRFSFSPAAISYLLGMMLLDSLGLYFALNSIRNIDAGIIWYSVAILLLVASLSTGFSITLIYQSSALAYYVRFSRLKMSNYILSLFIGSLISATIYSVTFAALITPLITKLTLDHFYEIIRLDNILPFIASALISSLFILSLTFTIIATLLVKVGAKASNYAYYIFFVLLAISDLSPSASSSLNPFYEAENIISYSLIHDSISIYSIEVALLAIVLLLLGNWILKKIKALRLEEVVW
ncbi:hypothetical protein [Saccharolobus islandicus]|uniref:Uncharacterized protein n=1 Tax=Saccharolobus islandicus (strain REY15A) TaxID=930945 RepID=F0NHA4_SACI5|nr:hypothetical protein [Sulfolobus islandicus]ADX84903.1 hypothetical protein SiRe_0828 [Sulfolobus islandicus REY15A]